VLVRLRADRCFYADPPPAARSPKGGRPRRHGARFAFADPTTWPTPTATLVSTDDQYGAVTVQAWSKLHPEQQRHPGHGSRGPRPIVRGTIIRVAVERVPARTRPPKVLWLWWAGLGELDLDLAWRAISAGSTWNTPSASPSRPSAGRPRGRATPNRPPGGPGWCSLAMPSCAWPAGVAGDQRLPWERPRPQPRLSPMRVRRGFPQLLVRLGSPAAAPKPAGRSPGRPKGRVAGPAPRYPAIKKPTKNPRRKLTTTAEAA
jgi:hypothetical protein